MDPRAVSLRVAVPDDRGFLAALYAESRIQEFRPTGLADAELAALLRGQFGMQLAQSEQDFPDAERWIVLLHGEPIGRLDLHLDAHTVRVLEIGLLPAARRRGVGTGLLHGVRSRAGARPVRLWVALDNVAARRLYGRLGFEPVTTTASHLEMEWPPPSSTTRWPSALWSASG